MHDLERFAFSIDEAAMKAGVGRDKLYAAVRVGDRSCPADACRRHRHPAR